MWSIIPSIYCIVSDLASAVGRIPFLNLRVPQVHTVVSQSLWHDEQTTNENKINGKKIRTKASHLVTHVSPLHVLTPRKQLEKVYYYCLHPFPIPSLATGAGSLSLSLNRNQVMSTFFGSAAATCNTIRDRAAQPDDLGRLLQVTMGRGKQETGKPYLRKAFAFPS